MATYINTLYAAPVDSREKNEHHALVIAPGMYKGMYIRSHGPNSRALDVRHDEYGDDDQSPVNEEYFGLVYTSEGVRLKFTAPEEYSDANELTKRLVVDTADNKDRLDLIYLQYAHKNLIYDKNKPFCGIIKGVADDNPVLPNIYTEEELRDTDLNAYDYGRIRIPMAYVIVKAGSQYVTDDDIINFPRIMTNSQVVDYISESLYGALGNYRTTGWEIIPNPGTLTATVTAGRGLIGGKLALSHSDQAVTDLKPRVVLMESTEAAAHLSVDNQPPYPSSLRINIKPARNRTISKTHTDPTSGNVVPTAISISGVWLDGTEEISATRTYIIPEDITPDMVDGLDIVTDPIISIDVDGIGLEDFITPIQDANATVTIHNVPRAYIYAVARENGRVKFVANYNPAHVLQTEMNELLLGYIGSDEDSVEDVYDFGSTVTSEIIEHLTLKLNGVARSFPLTNRPVENTEIVVLDGLVLEKDSPLNTGYTIDYNTNTITLQEEVPTPDGVTSGATGSKGATLWVKYRRRG